ncbi:DUF4114 domain-containing protein [Moorena sp. SIO2C4]|uniref:DUF4114 domain-containing protein n=1 Tax=Moorena sp. SIO2C4 TaxID=2607824 RepID=UPI0013C5D782|nr:DUF4114 domain-containing protein [Moorena sp. SIO2C4]NES40383.1 S8 family serine peptidase [Moorena sp. SIO2C4]
MLDIFEPFSNSENTLLSLDQNLESSNSSLNFSPSEQLLSLNSSDLDSDQLLISDHSDLTNDLNLNLETTATEPQANQDGSDLLTGTSNSETLVGNLDDLDTSEFDSGVFTVGADGDIAVDFLFDGGKYKGELAIFSLEDMAEFEPGSEAFIREAARRALIGSELGHVVIYDLKEGARFSGILGEHEKENWNRGEHQDVKTFAMNPGDEFGILFVPKGKVQQVFEDPSLDGSKRPLFSMTAADSEDVYGLGTMVDITGHGHTFGFDDQWGKPDSDYNDLIFKVIGATGEATLLSEIVTPESNWQNTDLGEALVDYFQLSDPDTSGSKVGFDLVELQLEYIAHQQTNESSSEFEPDNFLLQVNEGKVVIDAVAFDDADTLLNDLTALGLQQGVAFKSVVSGLLPIELINEVSALNSLAFAKPAYQPLTNIGAADAGAPISQIDQAINSNDARQNFNVNGAGVTVGVISDSYNVLGGEVNDIRSGDLPGVNNPNGFTAVVNILEEGSSRDTDEGRAMSQLIHDVAPGAGLAFHTGFNGTANFANGIKELMDDAGANIIVDDLSIYAEPMFQDGIIAQAVDEVVTQGVAYFSSAGNQANNSYESSFVSSGQRIQGSVAHDFNPGPGVDTLQQITIPGNANLVVSLQWDSPFLSASPESGGATSDLDIYLLDNTGNRVLARSTDRNIGRDAVEVLRFTNRNTDANGNPIPAQFNLAITNPRGDAPRNLKYILFNPGSGATVINEFSTNSPTVYGHHAAVGAMAVGSGFYRNPTTLAPSSSIGPTTILFDQSGNRLVTPEIRQKPEIVAPHGTNTTFFPAFVDNDGDGVDDNDFEPDNFPNFFGTSAAAPHAAGVAALMLQAFPGTPPDILYRAIQESALDMENPYTPDLDPGIDNATGSGLIQADQAIQRLEQIQARPEINLQIPSITVTPPNTRGDREFKGNGPRIRIQSQAVERGTTLQATGNVIFEETKSDFTTFDGFFSSSIDISSMYPGFVIDSIIRGGGLDTLETTDVDLHDRQVIYQDGDDLVARYEIQGDTRQKLRRGSDEPFVSISFNPVRLRLRSSTTGELVEDTFFLRDITSFEPPRVRGDDEFDGNGPRIEIETEISANGTILSPYVIATFEETIKDFTTFAGVLESFGVDVSQRYPGFVIDEIISDSRDVLETIDVDLLEPQTISLDNDELVREYTIQGDSKGDDQPSVTLSFNPVRVKLRPA